MKIVKKSTGPVSQGNVRPTIYNKYLMITYGEVNSNNNDGTCNVDIVTGFLIEGIKIPSSYYPSKNPITGGISYPPVGSSVKVLYPENDINSGWIEPASLNTKDSDVESELLGQGDKEILPGGWSKTFDQETGEMIFLNGTFNLVINPDTEAFELTDFKGNTFKSSASAWDINGNADNAVAYADLKLAFDQLKTDHDTLVSLFNAHIHTVTTPDTINGAAAPTLTLGTPSTADMSGSKVDNVRLA